MGGQAASSGSGTSFDNGQSATKQQNAGNNAGSASQPNVPGSQVTVTTDTGEEDGKTEQIIQQELSSGGSEQLGPPRPAMNIPLGRNEVLIRADEQEKNQDIYHVRGHVEIRFGGDILHSDQATYDSTTGQVTATGHVVFDGSRHNEHIVGSRATYDVSRDTGVFYDAIGSEGVKVKNKNMFLTTSTPFFFAGRVVEKLGPDLYRVNDGYVTSCQLPNPKWQFDSRVATIEVGDEAVLHHATLKLHGIPVFYFPVAEQPVDNLGRRSGFLIPEIGDSNSRGFIVGDAYYWAINRSMDATIGAALYNARGPAEFDSFRAVGSDYVFQATFYGVQDIKGYPTTGQNQGGQELRVNAFKELPDDWRGVLSVDYLSSYLFRLAFGLAYSETIDSEVRSAGFLMKTWDGFGLGVLASSYQNYESVTAGDYIQIVHAPSLELSTVERPFSRSNFVYSFDVAAEGVSRNEPGFETAPIVGRADAAPYLALAKLFHGWTLRPQVGARETYYTERLEAVPNSTMGAAVHDSINRNVANASFELRPPTLGKILNQKPFGRVLKHTIEPFAIYRYQTGIDNFSQIIRFDQRDILVDTNEVEYGVINRLYVKKASQISPCVQKAIRVPGAKNVAATSASKDKKGCPADTSPSGNVITWKLAQKYYANPTFGGALVPGQRNVFDSTIDLTGIAFLTEPRSLSPIISRLNFQSGYVDFQWAVDYDTVLGHMNSSALYAGYRLGNWYLNGGQTYINAPGESTVTSTGVVTPAIFNQWRVGAVYGNMNRQGFNGAFTVGVDSQFSYLQNATIQTNYNWDCCGLAFEYSRWKFPGIRDENAYRFSFSLANVGSFGNFKRIYRLY
jgi:LPS-assembly protein